MCGIFGIRSDNPDRFNHAEKQLATIRHRGPDETGTWTREGVFLGSCRLRIIDLLGGHQPMRNETTGNCITFNGELYNYLDLRPELQAKGRSFRTQSDTEVVLQAYEEWGPECLRRFNGMFAFALWDERNQLLFVARDRIGEKPLYYYTGTDRLVFASEIKSILADRSIPREVNPRGLANYLAFGHSLAPDTMYKHIQKLLPGHYLVSHGGKIEIAQYWDAGDEPQIVGQELTSEEECAERILDLLDDSVRRRMVADVPVGAFLSGGVDSSAVVGLMRRHATGKVKTFSLGFTAGGAYDELSDARRVAGYFETEHHELIVDHFDMVRTLERLVYHFDEPFSDPANFPVYLLSEFAKKQVTVVLTGEGGDELFGGYRRYVAEQAAPLFQSLPEAVTTGFLPGVLKTIPRLRRTKRIFNTLRMREPALRYAAWQEVFSAEMRKELLEPAISSEMGDYDPVWPYRRYYHPSLNGGKSADHINRLMYVDLKTWLPDAYLEKLDKATMAFGLEGRLPFLDYRLVELAAQIPSSLKIRGLATKRILKTALRELLPSAVLRKRKQGFAVPTDPWFRGELKTYVFETLLDNRARRRGYFNFPYIEKLYRLHSDGKEVHDAQLWTLLNFELWNRIFIDSSGDL
jgi:asparagine synthase (glutamine-hydrolysing)